MIGFSENLQIEIAVPRSERRHDDVHTAAVLETGVGQQGRLVDAAADLVHDALRDLEQVGLVAEPVGAMTSLPFFSMVWSGPLTMMSDTSGSLSSSSSGPKPSSSSTRTFSGELLAAIQQ